MDKGKHRADKHSDFWYSFLLFFPFCLILFFIFASAIFLSVFESSAFAMGTAGLIRDAALRLGLGGLAAVAMVFCIKGLWKRGTRAKGILLRLFGATVCLLLAVFLIRPVILDIPYWGNPEITYLGDLEFDADYSGDASARFYLRGTGSDGSQHRFSLNEQTYNEGNALWLAHSTMRARVSYLPHTDIVMGLRYLVSPAD